MEIDLQVVDLARDMMVTTIILSAPVLLVGMAVGLLVSLFQALTSIQVQTLSMVPKMLVVIIVALMLLAPSLAVLRYYAMEVFGQLNTFGLS